MKTAINWVFNYIKLTKDLFRTTLVTMHGKKSFIQVFLVELLVFFSPIYSHDYSSFANAEQITPVIAHANLEFQAIQGSSVSGDGQRHSYQAESTSATSDIWDVAFLWRYYNNHDQDDAQFRSIRCGFNVTLKGERFYGPLPPGFGQIKVGVYDSSSDQLYGYAVETSLERGGALFDILMTNFSDKNIDLEYYLGKLKLLPSDYRAQLFDPNKKKYEKNIQFSPTRIPLASHSSKHRFLIIGTESYFERLNKILKPGNTSFSKVFYNSQQNVIILHCTIPQNINILRCTLFDALGRELGTKTIPQHLTVSDYSLTGHMNLNPLLSSGTYMIHLLMLNHNGANLQINKKITIP